ncbi:MAG: hypothetical protein OEQ81_13160 [Flavobacteriaceae bacterium]|nr:hypothetical protein [Flavobacteriaceae bacterium]
MKSKILPLFFATFFTFSCTSDDMPPQQETDVPIAHDISVVSISDTAIYEYNILRSDNTVIGTDLTATYGLSPAFTYLNTTANKLTFYTTASNSFDIFQKEIGNSNIQVYDDICDRSADETHYFAGNSDEKIVQIGVGASTTGAPGPELFVKFFDPQTLNCKKVAVGNGYLASQQGALIYEESLYMAYQDFETDLYVLAIIDLATEERSGDIRFEMPYTIAIKEGTELHTFFQDDTYEVYDANSYALLSEGVLMDNGVLGAEGLLDTVFRDDGILVFIPYQQPSEISSGPAVMDLKTGDLIQGNDTYLFDLRRALIDDLGYEIFFTSFTVNLETNAIVCGFLRAGEVKGGVVYTNFDGDILKLVEIEGIPLEIVLQ